MVRVKSEELNNLNLSFNKLLTWFLDDRSCCLELDGDNRSLEIEYFDMENLYKLKSDYTDDEIKIFIKLGKQIIC